MQLEKERISDLGTNKAAELEVSAPTETAAAAAASSAFGGGRQFSGGGGEGGNGSDGGARRGVMNGLEVLWECVQDDVPGDGARWGVGVVGSPGALLLLLWWWWLVTWLIPVVTG